MKAQDRGRWWISKDDGMAKSVEKFAHVFFDDSATTLESSALDDYPIHTIFAFDQ